MLDMPRRSKLKLPPLKTGPEAFGERLARLRKERGLSQIALAEKIGIIQQLITDYERERIRMHAEMVIRFAKALGVTTDELLLGEKKPTAMSKLDISLKVARRLQKIEELSPSKQRTILQTIDMFLDGAGLGA